MTFFVACNCRECMWFQDDKCRKTHITISKARCIDYSQSGLEHTIKNLGVITQEIQAIKKCQFCGTEKKVKTWIPSGNICDSCKKALHKIRENKLGFGWLPK